MRRRSPEELRPRQLEVKERGLESLYRAVRDNQLVLYRTPGDRDRVLAEIRLLAGAFAAGQSFIDWNLGEVVDPVTGRTQFIKEEERGAGGLEDLLVFLQEHYSSPCVVLVSDAEVYFAADGSIRHEDVRTMLEIKRELERRDRAYRTVVFQVDPDENLSDKIKKMTFPVSRQISGQDRLNALADVAARRSRNDLLLPGRRGVILKACAGLSASEMRRMLEAVLSRGISNPEQIAENILEQREEMGAMAVGKWWEMKRMKEGGEINSLVGWDEFLDFVTMDKNLSGGLLLVGPPGTGKTTAAGEIARRLKRPLLTANIASWLSSLHGETEKGFAQAIKAVVNLGIPCVAFFDEGGRSLADGGRQTSDIMRRSLIEILKAVENSYQRNDKILWLIASNRLKGLPSELISRVSLKAKVPLPSRKVRLRIWEKIAREKLPSLARMSEEDVLYFLNLTEGMSPRGIEHLADHVINLLRGSSKRQEEIELLAVLVRAKRLAADMAADLFLEDEFDEVENKVWMKLTSVYDVNITGNLGRRDIYRGPRQLPAPRERDMFAFFE